MLTLAFEASAKAASVALCDGDALIAQYFQASGLTHSRTLLPMAEDILKNTEHTLDDVALLAVSHGPGSFTGVRIGVSTVKGLAWARDIPCVGVSTLEAMAYQGLSQPEGTLVCCCMDARRSQVYNALFELRGGVLTRLCPDRAIALEELGADINNCGKRVFLVGDGALLCYNYLSAKGAENAALAPDGARLQNACGVALAALGKTPVSSGELLPVYLRLSQAERERQARMK